MNTVGIEIGSYLDPNMIDIQGGPIDPINPSWGGGIMSLQDVPLIDGRIAVIDNEGVIVEIK